MKAILLDRICRPEEMQVSEIDMPKVERGWVMVKIKAAGLNHSESLLRQFEIENDYIRKPIVPGIECVGEVADASDSGLKIGDRVVALMGGMGRSFNGSYEEYALLPKTHVFKTTTSLDWISLAAVPETYFTAYGSLTEGLMLQKGDTLLIRGATSTVGQAAIQLGKALGARVVAACRKRDDFDRLRTIGADECVVDDGAISRQTMYVRPNKILELVGPKTLADSLETVAKPGIVCNTGLLGKVYTIPQFDPIKYIPNGAFLSGFFSNSPTQIIMDEIFELIDKFNITPLYAKVFALEQIAESHSLLESGTAGGKIILRICE